jgi:DNA-binding MarR family transcriptional regulator
VKTLGKPTRLDLNRAVPYLLSSTGGRMGNAFAKELKAYGLSLSEWRVCASLQHEAGQTLSELADHTSTDLSAMSRIIDRLEKAELLKRFKNEVDRRTIRIDLTPAGRQLTQTITPLAVRYEEMVLAGFTDDEAERLRDYLQRLHHNAGPL